ncbi:hypothetical protein J8I87_43530 [Paraburkholderia sp. LEh10]|uniref:hypothetical protein n=1 Tax=Paraburkholderia sp. LEh10 TaxID=2821353 RepID=UPI001AE43A29|nr:hypothetical protein [Paraburkholderia sp. LEh10]MBP0596333.1 hypothetical protein [Paraburkholderia sp. LEh10]
MRKEKRKKLAAHAFQAIFCTQKNVPTAPDAVSGSLASDSGAPRIKLQRSISINKIPFVLFESIRLFR